MGLSFFSTVTPAQLPIRSLRPVRALYIVVLPLLGLPVSAILIFFIPPLYPTSGRVIYIVISTR